MAYLFIFGPPLVVGAIVLLFGRRLLAGQGLRDRASWATAGLAGLAAGAAWFVFVVEWLFYAVGENEGEYYDFSAYAEYRHALDGWVGLAAAGGYALLAGALGLAAGIAWRRVHPAAGVVVALAACVAVVLPWEVPSRLERVEYGQDAVLHRARGAPGCLAYSVEGIYPPEDRRPPLLCLRFRGSPDFRARKVADELNESGIEPYEIPESIDVEGLELEQARWTRR
jgi:hypothetical protein